LTHLEEKSWCDPKGDYGSLQLFSCNASSRVIVLIVELDEYQENNMRHWIISVLFALFILPARAQTPGSDRIGLGVVIGAPTAITGKYWTTNDEAIDFGLGFWSSSWILVYGDYHWYWPGLFGGKTKFSTQLLPYMGVGGGFVSWPDRRDCGKWNCDRNGSGGMGIFARVPFGVEWYPGRPPLGVFVEISPGLTIIPGTSGFMDLGIGIRYYF
jgi:hypothetical protein